MTNVERILKKATEEVPPEPSYPYCNKGHKLTPVFSDKYQKYVWDCETCMSKGPVFGK